jgi:hypothetical protein
MRLFLLVEKSENDKISVHEASFGLVKRIGDSEHQRDAEEPRVCRNCKESRETRDYAATSNSLIPKEPRLMLFEFFRNPF